MDVTKGNVEILREGAISCEKILEVLLFDFRLGSSDLSFSVKHITISLLHI